MHDRRDVVRDEPMEMNRRGFLETGAGALTAATVLGAVPDALAQDKDKGPHSAALPKRVLGRTGVEVSILTLGTLRNPGLDRILRTAWANGVRYVDTAKSYGSEPGIARWLKDFPCIGSA
jgi:hypothetical protein